MPSRAADGGVVRRRTVEGRAVGGRAVLSGTHFAGVKPWQLGKRKAVRRFARYPDFRRWFREYRAMLSAHPGLRRIRRLRALEESIERVRAVS